MKRKPKMAIGQFTLSLHREPIPVLDEQVREELLNALADLLLEALGGEAGEHEDEKEVSDESKDHV